MPDHLASGPKHILMPHYLTRANIDRGLLKELVETDISWEPVLSWKDILKKRKKQTTTTKNHKSTKISQIKKSVPL